MEENQVNKRLLKAVPTPDPNSLTLEDKLLLLRRGNPSGGFRLDCSTARPYLGVVSMPSAYPVATTGQGKQPWEQGQEVQNRPGEPGS